MISPDALAAARPSDLESEGGHIPLSPGRSRWKLILVAVLIVSVVLCVWKGRNKAVAAPVDSHEVKRDVPSILPSVPSQSVIPPRLVWCSADRAVFEENGFRFEVVPGDVFGSDFVVLAVGVSGVDLSRGTWRFRARPSYPAVSSSNGLGGGGGSGQGSVRPNAAGKGAFGLSSTGNNH